MPPKRKRKRQRLARAVEWEFADESTGIPEYFEEPWESHKCGLTGKLYVVKAPGGEVERLRTIEHCLEALSHLISSHALKPYARGASHALHFPLCRDRRVPQTSECMHFERKHVDGYHKLRISKKEINSKEGPTIVHKVIGWHVLICTLRHGIPTQAGKDVARHSCHRTACVNPLHLIWGSASQNVADRVSKRQKREVLTQAAREAPKSVGARGIGASSVAWPLCKACRLGKESYHASRCAGAALWWPASCLTGGACWAGWLGREQSPFSLKPRSKASLHSNQQIM